MSVVIIRVTTAIRREVSCLGSGGRLVRGVATVFSRKMVGSGIRIGKSLTRLRKRNGLDSIIIRESRHKRKVYKALTGVGRYGDTR